MYVDKISNALKKKGSSFEIVNSCFELCRLETGELSIRKGSELVKRAVIKNVKQGEEWYDLYRKVLLFRAPYCFEDYLIYLEIDRPPEERFYQPRRKVLKVVVEELQALADDELDELFVSMPPRVGKLLADDTPVLTKDGWKNHGDIKVGDFVIAPNGEFVEVYNVNPKHHTTHTVTLSNGDKFECHFRHEWKVFDRRFNKWRLLETQQMIGHLKNKNRYNFQLPIKEPFKGNKKELPVDPYTLGVWLGDGANQAPRIHNDTKDLAIIGKIVDNGYVVSSQGTHNATGVIRTDFKGLRSDLQKIGLCHSRKRVDKFIPDEYLLASLEQRLELLAGLLDTDGCLIKKEHRYQFTTADEKLKETFISLIATFGWRTSVIERKPKLSSSGIQGKNIYWVIGFNPTLHIPCVLERKQLFEFSKQRKLSIVSIEESKHKQGNCISVVGGMYCVGKQLIPTHNTTMLLLFITWIMGRDGEASNLYSAFSDIITSAMYTGVLEVMTDSYTYNWKKVFNNSGIANTDAKKETIDIDRKKRYPTLTCRSLYGTLNGACDCKGYLISDDLIGGIEEALNKDRMIGAWSKVSNNLIPRAKQTAKKIWIGTRWSLIDPAGLRMDFLQNDEEGKKVRFKIINLPALNENDESNFDYDYNVGFNTDYYKQLRAQFERNNDMASWQAQYMGEPIERDGALFTPDTMNFYNGVIADEPVRNYMTVDVAWGGGDYVSGPVCVETENGDFIPDVVFNNGDKTITRPLIVDCIIKNNVKYVQFEANNGGSEYAEWVERELKQRGYKCTITSKSAPTNKRKEARIFERAPEIREFYYLDNGRRHKEYQLFMNNLYAFKIVGKNKNDDAPDSMAMLSEVRKRGKCTSVTTFSRKDLGI